MKRGVIHHKGITKIIELAAVILGILLLCSCGAKNNTAEDLANALQTNTVEDALHEAKSYEPLSLVRHEEMTGGRSIMLYPTVADEDYGYISSLIARRIRSAIRSIDSAVYTSFRVMCNECGVLSMVIYLYDLETDELIERLPLTFDLDVDGEIELSDCFEEGDGAWRGELPQLIEDAAALSNTILLSEIAPPEDDALFYLTHDSIVIMYRPYEVTLMSKPWPEFEIALADVGEWLKPLGGAGRLLKNAYVSEKNGSAEEYDTDSAA